MFKVADRWIKEGKIPIQILSHKWFHILETANSCNSANSTMHSTRATLYETEAHADCEFILATIQFRHTQTVYIFKPNKYSSDLFWLLNIIELIRLQIHWSDSLPSRHDIQQTILCQASQITRMQTVRSFAVCQMNEIFGETSDFYLAFLSVLSLSLSRFYFFLSRFYLTLFRPIWRERHHGWKANPIL